MERILVIDDDENIREMLLRFFEEKGYEVEVAGDGEEGLHRFKMNPSDIVVTDMLMPRKNGIEVIKELRGGSINVRIIAVSGGTGNTADARLREAVDSGADYILEKPFELQDMLALVQR